MASIKQMQEKIEKYNSLSTKMDGIIGACESLYSQINNSSVSLQGNIMGGKSYGDSDLSASSQDCQTIYSTASAIKSACAEKVSELKELIKKERARLAALESQNLASRPTTGCSVSYTPSYSKGCTGIRPATGCSGLK